SVVEMVENALKINQAGLVRHGVTVQRELDDSLRVQTDSHKVLQILINLVSNAKYAMSSTERVDRILTVRTEIETNGDEKHVSIIVSDNGEGIAPENLSRIFGYGFTTKRHGHGFGLHSSALAAKEIGGALSVESEGRGKGATF